MGTGIDGPPNVYPAGTEFDYSVWTANTRVDLFNVNWNNDYRDVVHFSSKSAMKSYFDNLSGSGITIQNLTYCKPGEDIYLNIPYNRVNRYNYLRASNPLQPIPDDIQKEFYYFILESEYISPNTTRIRLQLDIWQTYVYDLDFGNCFVERSHIAIANENNFDSFGRKYLTVAEGLDIGGEYQIIARRSEILIRNSAIAPTEAINGDIVVVSTIDLEQDPGTKTDPNQNTTKPSFVNGLPSGAGFYIYDNVGDYAAKMTDLADTPWISQGIISVTLMPSLSRYGNVSSIEAGHRVVNLVALPVKHTMFTDWRNNSEILNNIPAKYRHLKKFLTYPYMVIELTTWTGNPTILKPESWNDDNALVMERASFMPPNQKVEFIPRGYNRITGSQVDNLWGLTDTQIDTLLPEYAPYLTDSGDDSGDYLNMAVAVANFPTLPVVNNMALNYLAANTNQLAYQFKSADWSQQKAMAAAQAGYDVATGAIRAGNETTANVLAANAAQTANQNRTLAAQAAVNASSQAVAGLGTALTPGGLGGAAIAGLASAAATGINAGIQTQANDAALNIGNNQTAQNRMVNAGQEQLSRDTNTDLARFAARGDYANTIAGINAKIQDAQLIQPSVGGQFGGESINIAHDKLEMSIRWKMLDQANIAKIGDFWLRYGYAIGRFMTPPQDLKVMSKFSYWKMQETYIVSSMVPEGHKQGIRGILEKGVTVWGHPNYIGVTDLGDNVPLGGFTY